MPHQRNPPAPSPLIVRSELFVPRTEVLVLNQNLLVSADCEPISMSRASAFDMPRCAFPGDGGSDAKRKQSYEKSHFSRIDNDAGCNLRTGVCGNRRTERAVLA